MLDALEHPPAGFADVVRAHFCLRQDRVRALAEQWVAEAHRHGDASSHVAAMQQLCQRLDPLLRALGVPPLQQSDFEEAQRRGEERTAESTGASSASAALHAAAAPASPRAPASAAAAATAGGASAGVSHASVTLEHNVQRLCQLVPSAPRVRTACRAPQPAPCPASRAATNAQDVVESLVLTYTGDDGSVDVEAAAAALLEMA